VIKFGIIGCGNMGGAMLRQLLKRGIFAPQEVLCADKNPQLLARLKDELGVRTTPDNREAAKAPTVLLAVKPQFIQSVADEIHGAIAKDALVLSIVTGCSLSSLQAMLDLPDGAVIRVMPNTPALVGEGVLAACKSNQVTDAQWQFAFSMLSCMGLAQEVNENQMDAVTGLSGSSPAFAFLFLEALSDAGVRGGLPRDMALRFAAQTMLGSAKLALETGMHPGQLKDMVTSPAGTTIEGVAALEKGGFRFAVMDAVNAAMERARELGGKK